MKKKRNKIREIKKPESCFLKRALDKPWGKKSRGLIKGKNREGAKNIKNDKKRTNEEQSSTGDKN